MLDFFEIFVIVEDVQRVEGALEEPIVVFYDAHDLQTLERTDRIVPFQQGILVLAHSGSLAIDLLELVLATNWRHLELLLKEGVDLIFVHFVEFEVGLLGV